MCDHFGMKKNILPVPSSEFSSNIMDINLSCEHFYGFLVHFYFFFLRTVLLTFNSNRMLLSLCAYGENMTNDISTKIYTTLDIKLLLLGEARI